MAKLYEMCNEINSDELLPNREDLTQEEKELSGVYDDMIRISVGIEDIEDLKEDFRRVIEGEDENGES